MWKVGDSLPFAGRMAGLMMRKQVGAVLRASAEECDAQYVVQAYIEHWHLQCERVGSAEEVGHMGLCT
jgi:hypothetical protein